jgi:Ni,Fe-hydrogenase I large subunit
MDDAGRRSHPIEVENGRIKTHRTVVLSKWNAGLLTLAGVCGRSEIGVDSGIRIERER